MGPRRLALALCFFLLPALAGAQLGPAAGPPHLSNATAPHVHRAIGRLATAAAQGTSDEVVLPLTEVRIRRGRSDTSRQPPVQRLCLHPAVEIRRLRGHDAPQWTGALTDCSGRPTLRGMAAVSLLAQPGRDFSLDLPPAVAELRRVAPSAGLNLADELPSRGHVRPSRSSGVTVSHDAHTHDPVVQLGTAARVLHPRLLQMLQAVIDHFPGHAVEIISGYRPGEGASRHAHARAIDFRLQGVGYEELRDFCRTLPDAGVGFYPNSVFIHMDVRDPDEGRVFWADYSGPGETPRYGHWPPTDNDVQHEVNWMVNHAEGDLAPVRQREWGVAPEEPGDAHQAATAAP